MIFQLLKNSNSVAVPLLFRIFVDSKILIRFFGKKKFKNSVETAMILLHIYYIKMNGGRSSLRIQYGPHFFGCRIDIVLVSDEGLVEHEKSFTEENFQ